MFLLRDVSVLVLLAQLKVNRTKGSSCVTTIQICTRVTVIRADATRWKEIKSLTLSGL